MHINYDKIGEEFVNTILDDEEKAVLRIGMIPLHKFNYLKKCLFETFCEKLSKDEKSIYYKLPVKELVASLKEDFKKEVDRELSLSILKHGHLIV